MAFGASMAPNSRHGPVDILSTLVIAVRGVVVVSFSGSGHGFVDIGGRSVASRFWGPNLNAR